jgi:hypothetical protein
MLCATKGSAVSHNLPCTGSGSRRGSTFDGHGSLISKHTNQALPDLSPGARPKGPGTAISSDTHNAAAQRSRPSNPHDSTRLVSNTSTGPIAGARPTPSNRLDRSPSHLRPSDGICSEGVQHGQGGVSGLRDAGSEGRGGGETCACSSRPSSAAQR